MADLIAVGFDDEQRAAGAAREIVADDRLGVGADAVAVVVRGGDGGYAVQTEHHALPTATNWAMLWEPLFAGLFFVPVLGMPVGLGLGALIDRATAATAGPPFAEQIQDALQPGTSAVFMVIEAAEEDRLREVLVPFGGLILAAPLRGAAVRELHEVLHGDGA